MLCKDIDACYKEMNAYFEADECGYPFLMNIDDIASYRSIMSKIKADSTKHLVKLSDFCGIDDIPDVEKAITNATTQKKSVFVGISQFFMLQGENALQNMVANLINKSVLGHSVIILCGCQGILSSRESADPRLSRRITILDKPATSLPRIALVKSDEGELQAVDCNGIKALMQSLEEMSYGAEKAEIAVKTRFDASLFKLSMYQIVPINGVYSILARQFSDIAMATEESWGTDKQWRNLLEKLNEHKTFSAVIENVVGAVVNLSFFVDERFEKSDSIEAWYLWLAMKVIGTKENEYLSLSVRKSNSPKEFIANIYMELLYHKPTDNDFVVLYRERKRLIENLPENSVLMQQYCDHIGQFEKNAVYFLTDCTQKEKLLFLKFLSSYDYETSEILSVTQFAFPELYDYLGRFEFTEINTSVPPSSAELRMSLTRYFEEYKIQKLTNHIHDDFLELVNKYAVERPFYKLVPRISVINDIDRKNAQIHFFDALGVEFLSYIVAKCDKYGLQAKIQIATCELPSITEKNLEFKKFFVSVIDDNGNEVLPGTKELDELKHHSKTVDYRKCKEPIHLFMELEIIDAELLKIREMLVNHTFDKIIIVSDHGASRLSVIYQNESSLFALDGHSEHSGRCCKIDDNPHREEMAYENGYAVLANYDRFKGGRAANVEVHGGATLEETVIPIIELVMKPEKTAIYIVEPHIEFHNKEIVSIMIFSNVIISSPSIFVNGLNKTYQGTPSPDGKNYKFEIPDIKRSGEFTLSIYDGGKQLASGLCFQTKKAGVTTRDLF